MALAYIWAFRGTGIIGWGIAALNLVMLASVPFFGGHYLMDMIAGAATMLIALGLIRGAPALWKKPQAVPATANA
jgi:membrane-associated phospholipid phosphatase